MELSKPVIARTCAAIEAGTTGSASGPRSIFPSTENRLSSIWNACSTRVTLPEAVTNSRFRGTSTIWKPCLRSQAETTRTPSVPGAKRDRNCSGASHCW